MVDKVNHSKEEFGIIFRKFVPLRKPIALDKIRGRIGDFYPPQGYWYLNENKKGQKFLDAFVSSSFLKLVKSH